MPRTREIFTEWFYKFSKDDRMDSDSCGAFINSCTSDGCKGDDRRVKDVFIKYDDDKDGFLTLDNFLEFYRVASIQRN